MRYDLAPYASDAFSSRGRLHVEEGCKTRSEFQRDRDRIIHSTAFRRLKHKTQVFVAHEGDHFRTRLTHSLEVAQIARTMCRELALDEDLAEALALAHDLGHTPFGHAGEKALDEAMQSCGGFDHNEQALRILTRLEQRYAAFDGLNLTWECLEGLVKHNGPLTGARVNEKHKGGVKPFFLDYCAEQDLELADFPGPEAQIAAMSDDIAYNSHDIDDGLRAGLFTVQDVLEVPLVGPIFHDVMRQYPNLEGGRLVHESLRRLIGRMVRDLRLETERRLAELAPQTVEDIRTAKAPVAAFSERLFSDLKALKAFLLANMYRHYQVNRMAAKATTVIQDLYGFLLSDPQCLPDDWQHADLQPQSGPTMRLVGDYIAGMTDTYALKLHRELFHPGGIYL